MHAHNMMMTWGANDNSVYRLYIVAVFMQGPTRKARFRTYIIYLILLRVVVSTKNVAIFTVGIVMYIVSEPLIMTLSYITCEY